MIAESGVEAVRVRPTVVVGRGAHNAPANVYRQLAIPSLGGAAKIQMVHQDDVGRFFAHACESTAVGPVNLAADDVLTWSEVARLARRPAAPTPPRIVVPAVRAVSKVAPVARSAPELIDMFLHWPVADTTRLHDEFDFRLGYTSAEAIADQGRHSASHIVLGMKEIRRPTKLDSSGPHEPAQGDERGECVQVLAGQACGEFDTPRADPNYPEWTCANLAEAFPGPMTPLSLELIRDALFTGADQVATMLPLDEKVRDNVRRRQLAVFGHARPLSRFPPPPPAVCCPAASGRRAGPPLAPPPAPHLVGCAATAWIPMLERGVARCRYAGGRHALARALARRGDPPRLGPPPSRGRPAARPAPPPLAPPPAGEHRAASGRACRRRAPRSRARGRPRQRHRLARDGRRRRRRAPASGAQPGEHDPLQRRQPLRGGSGAPVRPSSPRARTTSSAIRRTAAGRPAETTATTSLAAVEPRAQPVRVAALDAGRHGRAHQRRSAPRSAAARAGRVSSASAATAAAHRAPPGPGRWRLTSAGGIRASAAPSTNPFSSRQSPATAGCTDASSAGPSTACNPAAAAVTTSGQ